MQKKHYVNSVNISDFSKNILHYAIFLPATTVQKILLFIHTQPFYSSLDFVLDNPGELVSEGTFHHLLGFLVQNEDNTGRHTNNLDGLPPIQKNCAPISAIPTILCRMPLLAQPFQFMINEYKQHT